MIKYIANHTFLIFLAFVAVLGVYLTLSILGKHVDDRLIGTLAIGFMGGLLGKAIS